MNRGKFLFSLLTALLFSTALSGQAYKITLLSQWQNNHLPRLDGYQIWNDLTGWKDTFKNREYIIAGSTDSIYFFDVTDPKKFVVCDVESGRSTGMVNRDYECYDHFVYCVSDNHNPGSLQVFDLQYLPDSVHKVYDSDSLSYNTHSIFIDRKSKRLYLCINRLKSGGVAAMDIMSLADPQRPTWIGRLNVPTFGDGSNVFRNVHEVYVRNDTAYCSTEYTGMWIFDLRDLQHQKVLGNISYYPQNGYNHSSWLNGDGKKIMFTDEIPGGLAIKIYDISQPSNARLLSLFQSNQNATAHNAYWIGDFAYVSYYHDGFYIFNIRDASNPYVEAFFHSSPWPPASYDGWKGCWGVYPFLPSGNIAISDMGEGIFLLRPDTLLSGLEPRTVSQSLNVYPNPFEDHFQVNLGQQHQEAITMSIFNMKGELCLHYQHIGPTFEVDCPELPEGIYYMKIQSGHQYQSVKLIKLP